MLKRGGALGGGVLTAAWTPLWEQPATWVLFSEATVGTFRDPPAPRCTHRSGGFIRVLVGEASGFLFPTISSVFLRKFFFEVLILLNSV